MDGYHKSKCQNKSESKVRSGKVREGKIVGERGRESESRESIAYMLGQSVISPNEAGV